jgi:type III secretory pathway component EscU
MIKLDRMFSQTFTGQDLTEQGPVDVQSLETEIGKELYREGERNLPVEESIEVAKELYREGERDSFVQDDQTRQDVVPDLTAQNEDIVPGFAGQGPVDVQSLETEIGKELYREGERNLPVEESIEVAKELYREGERDSFVQDDQTRQDVVPDLTAQNEDIVPGFAGQGPVDVQSLETEIGKELYREGERNLPVEESIEVAKELYREGERDSFVQDDQTRQDVPSQTFTGQDLTEQGPVDVQSLETEIGKELYREGERNLPVEESIEVAKELYREGERDSFVQDDQTRQDVVPDLTAQNEDIVPGFAGQGPVDVQSLETEIGKELYREGERNLPVEESIEVAKELYREGERDSFVQDDQTRQDVPSQTFTGQDEDY